MRIWEYSDGVFVDGSGGKFLHFWGSVVIGRRGPIRGTFEHFIWRRLELVAGRRWWLPALHSSKCYGQRKYGGLFSIVIIIAQVVYKHSIMQANNGGLLLDKLVFFVLVMFSLMV